MVDTTIEPAARLRLVIGKLSRRLRPTVAGTGLTPTSISVLFSVVRDGPLRLSELAEAEALNPTMLSRVVGSLAQDGLLRRVADPLDRRAALVEATAAGRRLRQKIHRERNDVLAVQLARLSDEDRRTLEEALPVLEELVELLRDRRA
ncbi:MarR family transcriptional regulator [Baekduia soli]|uniref:MarR family transcriptional regulator n=1 Tax=Baekduia soli TaxID=496014 RepID=A0A5B8U398_9ACTN|nr:MarR family transcriptional regulator [Baekduia soli]QEC47411.1 MarR family transcriptional regulator [Baekduia soli]